MTLVSGDMTSGEMTFGRLDRKARKEEGKSCVTSVTIVLFGTTLCQTSLSFFCKGQENITVFIKCRQRAKKPSTWWLEPPTFWENRVLKWESESLNLPTKLNWQAAYFYMLAVYFKTYWELWVVALSHLSHARVGHPLLPAVLLCKLTTLICFNTPSPECLNGPAWILSLGLIKI